MIKILYISGGLLSLGMGFAGILLPGLPTTPFVLLSAALFIRSSDRLYNYVLTSKIFGKYVRNYREKGGMSLKSKVISIVFMIIMISISVWRIPVLWLKLTVAAAGLTGAVVVMFFVKTVD